MYADIHLYQSFSSNHSKNAMLDFNNDLDNISAVQLIISNEHTKLADRARSLGLILDESL